MAKALPPNNTATPSEAYLAGLCHRTFLKLWSYPSLYRDQRVGLTGDGKELCDLLVIFDNEVLVFSDKDCVLRRDKEPLVAWRRWYKNAVLESANQVGGAIRWIKEHPDRIFTDRRCKLPFPIALPPAPRFHRIVTCRGAATASRDFFGGSGSLIVTNRKLAACTDEILHLGAIDEAGCVVHVLDEVSLEALMKTLDTARDLCDYLVEREAFLTRFQHVQAAGEEELIGYYLSNYSEELKRHYFKVDEGAEALNWVTIGEGFWAHWETSAARQSKMEADEISYSWDELANKFAYHMLTETQYFSWHGPASETEIALRWMAREPRVRRRMLVRSLLEAMEKTPAGAIRHRIMMPSNDGDPAWAFLVAGRPPNMSVETYREARYDMLYKFCCVAKYIHPELVDIVGIAVESNLDELSEDLMYVDAREWDDEQAALAAEFQKELGILLNPTELSGMESEFPTSGRKDTQ